MRKLAVVVVLLLAGIVGFAFYRGWFRVSTDNANHMPSATITVDKNKIHDDEQRAKETVGGSGQKAKEKTVEVADKVNESEHPR